MPKETFFNLPDEKRQSILDLAVRVFAENDYKNVSISDFVRQAGIAKGSFYQYFEDKKDLYLYLLELARREKQAYIAANPPPDVDMDLFAYLRWMYSVGVRFEFQNPQLARIGFRAIYGDAPLSSEARQVLEDGTRQFFQKLVSQGKRKGAFREDLDPGLAAFMFDAVFTKLGDYIIRRTGGHPEDPSTVRAALDNPEAEFVYASIVNILEYGMADNHRGKPASQDKKKHDSSQ